MRNARFAAAMIGAYLLADFKPNETVLPVIKKPKRSPEASAAKIAAAQAKRQRRAARKRQ